VSIDQVRQDPGSIRSIPDPELRSNALKAYNQVRTLTYVTCFFFIRSFPVFEYDIHSGHSCGYFVVGRGLISCGVRVDFHPYNRTLG